MAASLIAIDWGSTNRRIFVLSDSGRVMHAAHDGQGLRHVAPGGYASEIAAIRADLGDLPVALAGMVGSANGWVDVGYVGCPAGPHDLAAALWWVEPGRTGIVPGVSDPAGDVMRGEEVQFLGAAAAGLAPNDGLLCQPGTHCKWVHVEAGRITGFTTAMTGELFAMLRAHSLLAEFLGAEVVDGAAFREGVVAGLSGRLTTQLFRVRAAALLGLRQAGDSAAYTSGLLIGHDVGGAGFAQGQPIFVVADQPLADLYAAAITLAGGVPRAVDSQAAFVAGISQIWRLAHHGRTV